MRVRALHEAEVFETPEIGADRALRAAEMLREVHLPGVDGFVTDDALQPRRFDPAS